MSQAKTKVCGAWLGLATHGAVTARLHETYHDSERLLCREPRPSRRMSLLELGQYYTYFVEPFLLSRDHEYESFTICIYRYLRRLVSED